MDQGDSPEEESMAESLEVKPEPMEVESIGVRKGRRKKEAAGQRVRRYWKKLLQVGEWMVEVPSNIGEFVVGSRAEGNKCLIILKGYDL